jgi:hypothetical protein
MPVYQFQGQHYDLPDGLSNEQAIAKIKGHLGKAESPSLIDQGLDAATQFAKNTGGTLAGIGDVLTGIPKGLVSIGASGMAKIAAPELNFKELRTAGQEAVEDFVPSMGRSFNIQNNPGYKAVMDIASLPGQGIEYLGRKAEEAGATPNVAGLGMLGADILGYGVGIPGAKYVGKGLKKVVETVDPGLRNITPESVRAKMDKNGMANEGIDADMAAQAAAPKPATMPEQFAGMTKESPMDRMTRDLGGDPFAPAEEFTPMSQMAKDLTAERSTPAQRAAQDILDERQKQMEFEVARTARPELNAAELQRREAAPTGYKESLVAQEEAAKVERQRRDSELSQAAGAGEQAPLFEPYANMHRAYTEMFAKTDEGKRPFNITEFKQTLENLSKEEGTAFPMPENIETAYTDYLNSIEPKQGDLFQAHADLHAPSHKTWGEMTPQEKSKATRALNKLRNQRGGMDPEMFKVLGKAIVESGALRGVHDTQQLTAAKALQFTPNNPLNKVPGIGDKLREVGNAMIASPDEAVALAKTAPDVSQNMVQKGVNAFTKGGIYLKAKVNNPVVHYGVDRFLDAENVARADVTEKLNNNYLGTLRDLSPAERTKAFEVLNLADKHQVEITPAMMQKYGLSDKVQVFIDMHQHTMADVLKSINEARESVGKKPIAAREAYSAMNMTGDFRKVVYKMVDGKQEVVGVIGADTKNIGKRSLSALEKNVLAKDPTLQFGPLQDMSKTSRSARGTPHEAFQDVLATLGEDNPSIKEFVETLRQVANDDPSNYLGMQKHTMQKKGVFGMEGRKFWESTEENARAFFENQVRYIESGLTWGHLSKAAKDVNDVIRNPEVVKNQSNAIRLVDDYMQNALGINPSRMGKAVDDVMNATFGAFGIGPSVPRAAMGYARLAANTAMLSLSPAFLTLQLIQPITAMPAMSAFLRGRGGATGLTGFGYANMAEGSLALIKDQMGQKLSPVMEGAIKYAKDNHVYATDMVQHSNQISKGVEYYASTVAQAPAAALETGTRSMVYMGLVSMLHESGLTPKQGLYQQAHRFTDMAMVNYSALEKPAIYNSLGPIGSLAYNLKSFGHNEISRWAMFAREIGNDANAVPILTQMATTIAIAGVMGLPFFSQWEMIYDYITKKMGTPRNLTLDVMDASKSVGKALGPNGAYALSHGAPTMLGVDLSTRTGLGDVIPSAASDAAFAGGGKLYEMGKATGRAVLNPSEENLKSAAINLAPPVLQGPMDVAWYQKNGMAYSKDPTKLKPTAVRNDTDVLLKKIGFMGINESAQKQKQYQQAQLDAAYTEFRSTAMQTIAQDLFRNRPIDQKTLDKYFKTGQGDPKTFETELNRLAIEQNMSPQDYLLLRQAASNKIPQLRSLQRRTQ